MVDRCARFYSEVARDFALAPPRFCASPSLSQASTAIRANLHPLPKRRPGKSPSSARDRTASAGSLRSAAASSSVSTSSVRTSGAFATSTRPTETGPAAGVNRSARSSLTRCCLCRPVASARRSRAAACSLGNLTNSGVRWVGMTRRYHMLSSDINTESQAAGVSIATALCIAPRGQTDCCSRGWPSETDARAATLTGRVVRRNESGELADRSGHL